MKFGRSLEGAAGLIFETTVPSKCTTISLSIGAPSARAPLKYFREAAISSSSSSQADQLWHRFSPLPAGSPTVESPSCGWCFWVDAFCRTEAGRQAGPHGHRCQRSLCVLRLMMMPRCRHFGSFCLLTSTSHKDGLGGSFQCCLHIINIFSWLQ